MPSFTEVMFPQLPVPVVLASASPRRIEMMEEHGISPLVIPADTDETIPAGLDVRQTVMYLALKKALHVESLLKNTDEAAGRPIRSTDARSNPGSPAEGCAVSVDTPSEETADYSHIIEAISQGSAVSIVGSDPILREVAASLLATGMGCIVAADTVVYKGRIIGKPIDEQDALNILMDLRGVAHEVYTGVAILRAGGKKRRLFYERTKVFFKDYSEDDLYDYIKSGEPLDKAGAYAIQGGFGRFIHHIEGDRNNVIGFPWQRFVEELAEL